METLRVPQLGEGIVEVRILRLFKEVGDTVERDEPLYEVETDKATLEMESAVAGTVREWLVQEGDLVPVGAPVATIESVGSTAGAAPAEVVPPESVQGDYSNRDNGDQNNGHLERAELKAPPAARVAPRVRALARAKGLPDAEIDRIAAERGGRLTVEDIEALPEDPRPANSDAGFSDVPASPVRQRLNQLLEASLRRVVPAVVATRFEDDVLIRASRALQRASGAVFATDFVAFAHLVAEAAAQHPALRTRRLGSDRLRVYSHVHLGLSALTDDGELVSGVIADADTIGFPEFAARYRHALEAARGGTSTTDGNVTLNLSRLDSDNAQFAVPVVVPPAVATLFLGSPAGRGGVTERQLVLAFDHLVFNGAEAAAFLDTVVETLKRAAGRETCAAAAPASRPARSEPSAHLLEQVRDLAEQITGNPVDPDTPLGQQGLNSAGATLLAGRLNETFRAGLPTTAVWHHPTCRALAAALGPDTGDRPAPRPERPQVRGRPRETSSGSEPIAVIGVACRYPESPDLESFWRLLCSERDAFRAVPPERLPGFDPATLPLEDPVDVRAGLLDRIDGFDAKFFGIGPRLAAATDPQQRLLLELSWQAWENAAIDPDSLAGSSTAVFIGAGGSDYRELAVDTGSADAYLGPGTLPSYLANRLSQFYDLAGPSLTVDAACSSGLTAVAMAVDALRAGKCELALAGSANLICNGLNAIAYYRAGMLSPSGRGTAFDDSCDGYVRGEGGGVLVLKPLSQAQRDGDPIIGVIRGVAVNHGGRAASQTAPNPQAQTRLIRDALADAGLSAGDLGYLEAHGTATPLGDPLEIESLRAALGDTSRHEGPGGRLWVGSVKAHIGHLEGAAGIAGLIKALLVVGRGRIPALPGFTALNRHIDLSGSPVSIAAEAQDWPTETGTRRAGINSFGLGGSNTHVIVEQAPSTRQAPESHGRAHVLPLSAASADAVRALAGRLADFLARHPDTSLAAVAATLQYGRKHLGTRRLLQADDVPAAVQGLREIEAGAVTAEDVSSPVSSWAAGEPVDWASLWGDAPVPSRIALVPYPFQRRSFWLRRQRTGASAPRPAEESHAQR